MQTKPAPFPYYFSFSSVTSLTHARWGPASRLFPLARLGKVLFTPDFILVGRLGGLVNLIFGPFQPQATPI